ncbi:MAG: MiaB/RimO family radical SAM methylthiotransferase [bacterium]|nr:MiaB/RimO family radical SAM methylthiotransferase [bacterium]
MRNQKKLNNFFVKSFGCQYNEFDATTLTNSLKQIGLVETTLDEADFVFVLNCSVRKTGVDRAMGFVRNLESKKIYLSGCVLKPDKKRFLKKNVELFELDNIDKLFTSELLTFNLQLPTISKFIPIMKGCNNFCSYCVVPYTRGREVSRPFEDAVNDVKKAIAADHKEIWLLGQNVNSYDGPPPLQGGVRGGENNNNKRFRFAQLLTEINNISGNFLIYFTSNHPKDMSDEIIEAVATLPKIAKFIHLPVQSGSNKVLRSMNRPYTRDEYLKLVKKIKARIPNVKITTDVIVGYPNETEADFQKTVDIFKKVGYFQAYVNKYSPREGTAAHKLGDPVLWSEKERRWRILNEIANKN